MLLYYLRLAAKSVVSTPWLTLLTIASVGLGIAVPTTMLSIQNVFARNPLPEKSDVLYNVRVDSWDPDQDFFNARAGDPPKHITYQDMSGLLELDGPIGATGIASALAFAFPDDDRMRPYPAKVRLCHGDFFSMFDAPFRFGGPWSRQSFGSVENVIVLSHESNDKHFAGRDSVGETIRLGNLSYKVVGVLAPWRPTPQFYDVINNAFGKPRDFFLPFDTIRDDGAGLTRVGDNDNWGPPIDRDDPQTFFVASETTWIQYWAEVPADRIDRYRQSVDNYALAQKSLGRFPRPLNNRVLPLMEWLEVREIVPPATLALVVIALLFLTVCCLNLTGLLLSKFLARAGVLGVHRALGASKASIFWQRLIECEVVGILGGVLGVSLAALALRVLDNMMPDRFIAPELFHIDAYTLLVALVLSLAAGLLSGIYPAWRACRIAPALQLKLQ